MMRSGVHAPGFTLLEVMIALAIVAVAVVSLLGLGSRAIGIHDRLERMTQATLLAQHRLAGIEVAARQQTAQAEATAGVFEPPFEAYRWQVAYEETPVPSVRMVTVTVVWGDETRNERVELNSFLVR